MKKAVLGLMIIAAVCSLAVAQLEEPIVTVRVVPGEENFKPGQSYPLTLEITIRSPFHINADLPSEDYLIGTTVDFKSLPGVTYGKIIFPPAETRHLGFSENPLAVYEGTIKVTAEVFLAADFGGNEIEIAGVVGFQACDDRSCLPPDEAAFSLKVPVEDPVKPEVPTVAAPVEKKAEPAAVQEAVKPASRFEGRGLLPLFLLVFIGGLALNLTPCVYPLIPITISYFGGQSGGKKGGLAAHAVLYVIGMAITYSVLGSIAAFTGSLFGAALQHPPVLIFIALVMVFLSLSMFDVYEFRLPSFLNRLAGRSQKDYLGTLLMGLTVGIVAAPCIGPFVLGLLTYVGNRGNVLLGFSLFFVLALGLGIPFLFLGLFSRGLTKLPRSGAWMVWVRKIFGFILIAMAVYFLEPLFPDSLLYHLSLALIMLIAGLYMAWLEPTQTPGKMFRYVRTIVGIVFFGLALVVASSGLKGYIDETLASQGNGTPADSIAWLPYSEEKLAEASQGGLPIFINSFADWCIPCKELDVLTFSHREVIAASREFVMLKADLTSTKDESAKAFTKKYGIKGVPTLIFLKPDGSEIEELRVTGFEPKNVFLPKMKRALELSSLK
ncbi:MAG: cytochrome c biogenesis protein CcdA [Candidatus Aminicenantales bacterium]